MSKRMMTGLLVGCAAVGLGVAWMQAHRVERILGQQRLTSQLLAQDEVPKPSAPPVTFVDDNRPRDSELVPKRALDSLEGAALTINMKSLQSAQRRQIIQNTLQQRLKEFHAAKDDETKQKARKVLASALGDYFDFQQDERERELTPLEKQVVVLRAQLKKRAELREKLIQHRLEELIQDAEGVGWGAEDLTRTGTLNGLSPNLPVSPMLAGDEDDRPSLALGGGRAPDVAAQKIIPLQKGIHQQMQRYAGANNDEVKQRARGELSQLLEQLFDAQQEQREHELKPLEERIAMMREQLKKRAAMKEKLVQHRLEGLLQDAEGLGWGTEGGARSSSRLSGGGLVPRASGIEYRSDDEDAR